MLCFVLDFLWDLYLVNFKPYDTFLNRRTTAGLPLPQSEKMLVEKVSRYQIGHYFYRGKAVIFLSGCPEQWCPAVKDQRYPLVGLIECLHRDIILRLSGCFSKMNMKEMNWIISDAGLEFTVNPIIIFPPIMTHDYNNSFPKKTDNCRFSRRPRSDCVCIFLFFFFR